MPATIAEQPRRIRLRNVFLRRTDFSGADLRGADLADARNLTLEQLARSTTDESTRLPSYLDRSALETRAHSL